MRSWFFAVPEVVEPVSQEVLRPVQVGRGELRGEVVSSSVKKAERPSVVSFVSPSKKKFAKE